MDILKYKDYEGTAELDMTRRVCRGKLLFIDDVVTYEADHPDKLQAEFEAAVDDYLQTCETVGKEPQRPFRGMFNVRISPALHRAASLRAIEDDVSLNDVVVQALKAYVNTLSVVRHTVQVTLVAKELTTRTTTTTGMPQWETRYAH
ncbi:MAG: hypothetical protein RLZZ484_273 [Pseudomonadota bacterium]|jgi:predicted HicB family RNase H-like nuclease